MHLMPCRFQQRPLSTRVHSRMQQLPFYRGFKTQRLRSSCRGSCQVHHATMPWSRAWKDADESESAGRELQWFQVHHGKRAETREVPLGPLGSPNIGGPRKLSCRKTMLPVGSHQAPLYTCRDDRGNRLNARCIMKRQLGFRGLVVGFSH